jgi:hypothetical protein
MKLAIMALLFSFIAAQPCPCQEKSCMVGVDFASSARGSACVSACYSFNRHWSSKGEVSITYGRLAHEKSPLEQEHDAEFGISTNTSGERGTISHCAIFTYWPYEAFSGPYISIGTQSYRGIDIITEAGYMIPIWRGISLSTSVRVPMSLGFYASSLRIGIYYRY